MDFIDFIIQLELMSGRRDFIDFIGSFDGYKVNLVISLVFNLLGRPIKL